MVDDVAVVMPAYREERLVARAIARVPAWVRWLVVVDDGSDDETAARASAALAARDATGQGVALLSLRPNRGVGAAIVAGYRAARARGAAHVVVMAGDDQMDPADLPALLAPLVAGEADYVKGNRLRHPSFRAMPWERRLAGHVLGLATSLASGLAVGDSQCGFTAISARALDALPLDDLWPRYGYPNDLLCLLGRAGLRVREVPVRAVYADERSGVRPRHALRILWLLGRQGLARARAGAIFTR